MAIDLLLDRRPFVAPFDVCWRERLADVKTTSALSGPAAPRSDVTASQGDALETGLHRPVLFFGEESLIRKLKVNVAARDFNTGRFRINRLPFPIEIHSSLPSGRSILPADCPGCIRPCDFST